MNTYFMCIGIRKFNFYAHFCSIFRAAPQQGEFPTRTDTGPAGRGPGGPPTAPQTAPQQGRHEAHHPAAEDAGQLKANSK